MIHHRGNTNPHQYLEKGFSVTFLFYFLFLLLHEHPERHCLSVNKWFSTRIPFDYVYSPLYSLIAQNHSVQKEKKVAEKHKSVSFSRSLRFTSYTMLLTPAVLGSLTAVEKHESLKNAANSFGRRPLIGQRALPPFDLLRGG